MISIWSYRDEQTGMGQVAGFLARELSADEEVAMVEWRTRRIFSRWKGGARFEGDEPLADVAQGCALGVGNLAELPEVVGAPRIGLGVWEGTRIPRPWRRGLRGLDALWVPTTWGKGLLERAGMDPRKITVVPHGVDTDFFRPGPTSSAGASRPFRFLSVGKWEQRKGHEILLRTFDGIFGGSQEVELVLHCGSHVMAEARESSHRLLGRVPANVHFSPNRSYEQLPSLYQEADCFVLATRAEAWGLPISEALACGLPAIATDYSGPTAFVHERNGYPVRIAGMSWVRDPLYYPSAWHRVPQYGRWAEPDPDHLARRLREAVEDRTGLRERGLAARREMVARWTWREAGRQARAALDQARISIGAPLS